MKSKGFCFLFLYFVLDVEKIFDTNLPFILILGSSSGSDNSDSSGSSSESSGSSSESSENEYEELIEAKPSNDAKNGQEKKSKKRNQIRIVSVWLFVLGSLLCLSVLCLC